jgi:hypothetical protein
MHQAWVKYVVLGALAVLGVAGGLYFSSPWEGKAEPPPGPANPVGGTDFAELSHKFRLTALDAKDQIEAPSLAADGAGRVFLAWASKTSETERTIFLARTENPGSTFVPPTAIARAAVYRSVSRTTGKVGYERRATPHVAADGDRLLLAWGEALPDGSSMRMVLATSSDAGATFSAPRPVHRGEHAKATFTGLAVGSGGAAVCTWLDDRAGFQQPYAAVRPTGQTDFDSEQLVHPGEAEQGVCPCCPTAAAFGPDGTLYVAFRNIRDGYRDMAISRKKLGQTSFEPAVPVVPPAWKFDGCPHDGPSLVVAGGALHVVWMDARFGPQRCWYARSGLGDWKFQARELHSIPSGSQGNAKLFADKTGGLHVVWEESVTEEAEDTHAGHKHGAPKVGTGGGRAILYAFMAPGTAAFGPARAVAPQPGTFQTRPAIVCNASGDLYVAWNELDQKGKAVVVTLLAAGGRP